MKTRMIIPWFGPWPPWFRYFLQSCAWNRDIQWLLVGNAPPLPAAPVNVQFLGMSLDEFSRIISSKLKLPVRLINPYKICDLRPAMGQIFDEELEGYDYWGYSDLDLVYGDILQHAGGFMEKQADVIGVRKEYLAGHFALYKNSPEINSLYKVFPGHEKIFTDTGHHYGFDERSGVYGKSLWKTGKYRELKRLYRAVEKPYHKLMFRLAGHRLKNRDMDQITQTLSGQGKIVLERETLVRSDLWYKKKGIPGWVIVWNRGGLTDTRSGEHFLHFHLILSKNKPGFFIEDWKENTRFLISPSGIRIQEV